MKEWDCKVPGIGTVYGYYRGTVYAETAEEAMELAAKEAVGWEFTTDSMTYDPDDDECPDVSLVGQASKEYDNDDE